VGFGPSKDETPQAEAYATEPDLNDDDVALLKIWISATEKNRTL
jgi:hypothetical protein